MAEIIVHTGYCEEHHDTYHMIDIHGKCYGTGSREMEKKGYRYIRHVGGGWFKFITPSPLNVKPWLLIEEPEPPEHDIHVLEPDF